MTSGKNSYGQRGTADSPQARVSSQRPKVFQILDPLEAFPVLLDAEDDGDFVGFFADQKIKSALS